MTAPKSRVERRLLETYMATSEHKVEMWDAGQKAYRAMRKLRPYLPTWSKLDQWEKARVVHHAAQQAVIENRFCGHLYERTKQIGATGCK